MRVVGVLPAASLIAGVAVGLSAGGPRPFAWTSWVAVAVAALAWLRRWDYLAATALVLGFASGGAAIAANSREEALRPSLRVVLEETFGGFALDTLGPAGRHDPVPTRAVILEDAVSRDGFVSLRVAVREVELAGKWRHAQGVVVLSVSGAASPADLARWTAGRTVEVPVTFRRPARYLNDGVPDGEVDLAMGGTALFGSVKSALLIDLRGDAGPLSEAAAKARARVRNAVERWVGGRNPTAGAITTAVLMGERASIPDDVREQLQAAGTYHVIAISGGNIAIFAALVAALCALSGLGPRASAVAVIVPLAAYAFIVVSGPSVRRAVLVAMVYLASRVFDHRTRAWQATAVAASLMVVIWPLDLRDAGFQLTFGATGALLALSDRVVPPRSWPVFARWAAAAVAASVAVELALLPVQAVAFSRVTFAGVLLNLLAVPAMAVVQVAGMATVALDAVSLPAGIPGAAADWAARVIVASAWWVEYVPRLAPRVPPPHMLLVAAYYTCVAVVVAGPPRTRPVFLLATATGAIVIAAAVPLSRVHARVPHETRLTMLDVGQGDAILLEIPGDAPLLVDAGGRPFGGGLDVGTRVVAPALWARGVRSLSTMLITHGDPDHIGGAAGVLSSLAVGEAWFGVRVPRHVAGNELLDDLAARRIAGRFLRAGTTLQRGSVRLRILHPFEPDWERPRVRNDDSVVVEAVHGDVAILLTGDISAEVERAIAPQLTPAPIRVLKVAHHGSRTSSSLELLEAWRPQLALISAGRGNTFGHPRPEVLQRLARAGARVLRTDRDGQITVETDGRTLRWRTFNAVSPSATRLPSGRATRPAARPPGSPVPPPSDRTGR